MPKLIRTYLDAQASKAKQWGIAQKTNRRRHIHTGRSLSSNVHGRGLAMKPLIADVESFTLVNADGKSIAVRAMENNELFRLAIGGLWPFRIISSVTLGLFRGKNCDVWSR